MSDTTELVDLAVIFPDLEIEYGAGRHGTVAGTASA